MRKGSPNLPPRIVIYGRPAVGKSSMASASESPIVFMSPGETGLHTLMDGGIVDKTIPNIEIQDWLSFMGLIDDLRTANHSRKTLVIDVINGIEKLANEFVCKTQYGNNMGADGFMNYHVGYRTVAMGVWKEMFVALDRLRTEKNMLILMLAHTGIGKLANPLGLDYSRWVPNFDGKWSWDSTFAWADIVLFADYEVTAVKEKGEQRAKGHGDKRVMRTTWDPGYDAKNRHNLPDIIDMGSSGKEAWDNLQKELKHEEK